MNIKFFSCLFTLTMLLFSGSMMAQTFSGAGAAIPSAGTSGTDDYTVTVADCGVIGSGASIDEVKVLNITHTFASDIDIDLISPAGTSIGLIYDDGGSGGLDNGPCTFTFQTGATDPDNWDFAGDVPDPCAGDIFDPALETQGGSAAGEGFAAFDGESVTGVWTLRVTDDAGGDSGTFTGWEVTFSGLTASSPFAAPAAMVLDNSPGLCGANVTLIATGGCPGIENDFNAGGLDASGFYPSGTTTVTWTGGGSTTVTVTDTEAPVVVCPGDMTIHLDPGACEQVISYDVTATDNCPFLTGPFQAPALATNQGGGSTFDMIYFDVENTGTDDISITSLDQGVFAGGTWNWEVYTATASAGNETNAGAWTQVGAASVASGGNSMANIPLTTPVTVPAGGSVGIAIGISLPAGFPLLYDFPPVAAYPTDANGISMSGGSATTTLFAGTLLAPRGWVGNVNYQVGGEVEIIPDPANTVASGGAFPIGTTTLTYTALDAMGNLGSCTFSVTVEEFVATSNDITCNSLVHISLDENCEATVGADQILEGDNYGCYDNFAVTFAGSGLPLVLNSTHVGQTIEVMVTNPAGVPCWGYILVEDKIAPTITCYDMDIDCDEALPTEPAPEATTAGSVATITDGGNGGAVGGMVYFDVTNLTTGNLVLTAFDMNITANTLVDVYTKSGTFAGSEANAAAWTLAGQLDATTGAVSGPFPGDGTLTPATGGNISIAPGVNGIILHPLTAAHNYTNGNGANQSFGDAFIQLDLGSGSNGPFGTGGLFNPRVFNGAVHYLQPLPQISATDACSAVTVTFTDEIEELGCNASGFSEIITRTWTATDASGNSSSCTSTYRRIIQTLDDVVAGLPTDITVNYDANCNLNIPDPLDDLGCSNIGIALDGTPVIIDICEGSYKMLRKYIIVDWCTNETVEHLQIVKILDEEGPSLACPSDLTISTNSNECVGGVILPYPTVSDCGTATANIDLVPTSASGVISYNVGQQVWLISELAPGAHTVTWTATDDCGNESACDFTITAEDQIAPIAICDEHTILGIGSDGTATINATTFDDGSYDNCGIVEMTARRMDNPACPGFDGTGFAATVPFYCCDVNTTVMVEFRVRDAAGNVNSCMVEVEVQDKINPTVICPSDKDVECSETYLDYIVVGQPLPQDAVDANGSALASDNCPGVTLTNNVISNTVDCGNGIVTIVWTATDAVGRTSSCIQRYFVANNDPFYINANNDNDPNDDVVWPSDVELTTCGSGLEPSDLDSYPEIFEGACDNIAVGHDDQVLNFGVGDACLKVLRKWYVIDWCQAQGNQDPTVPGPGVWHYTQIIKVINSSDPNVTVVDFPSVVDNYDADCGNVFAAFEITADDDCTDAADIQVSWEFSTGLSGTGLSASGAFANGSYSLTFTVSDGCNNTVWEIHDFTVVDAKKPTPVCIFGIATTVMPSAGAVTIWASDFESGSSYDNCTAYGDLEFSFSEDVNSDFITITCDDIPVDGLYPITLYVTDEAGNFDFCSTFVSVQDPNGACVGPTSTPITGTIENENQEVIEEVIVTLSNAAGPMGLPVVTSSNGTYTFTGNTSASYDVTPGKDINYLNGVTTYDLVLISKHILGTEVLDSPYKMIAADANNTQSITTLDIVKLRALILHIDDELSANTSWRFVDANHVFGSNVFDFPEYVSPTVNGSVFNPANFMAVKIGDVNGTASPNSLLGSDSRTFAGELALSLEATEVAAGETFTVDFKANDFKNIAGYQFTLGFDNSAVEFVDVTSNLAGLDVANFGLTKLSEGVITTSWNSNEGVTVANGSALFSMTFRATAAVNTQELLSINSRYTESEAYSNSDLYNVVLEFNGNTVSNGFELFQNTPNPFKAETTIGFNMPAAGAVTLTIYDVSGRTLRLIEMDAVKGANSVNVNRDGINATGVLYYQLETATETATKKMILVD